MLVFRNNCSISNPFTIVFLCGSKYSPNNAKYKRNILKKYIAISSEDDHNELLKEEENSDNYIVSPLLNI